MPYISDEMRRQVEKRAKGRCEYCQTQRAIVVSMQVDHVRPVADGEKPFSRICAWLASAAMGRNSTHNLLSIQKRGSRFPCLTRASRTGVITSPGAMTKPKSLA